LVGFWFWCFKWYRSGWGLVCIVPCAVAETIIRYLSAYTNRRPEGNPGESHCDVRSPIPRLVVFIGWLPTPGMPEGFEPVHLVPCLVGLSRSYMPVRQWMPSQPFLGGLFVPSVVCRQSSASTERQGIHRSDSTELMVTVGCFWRGRA